MYVTILPCIFLSYSTITTYASITLVQPGNVWADMLSSSNGTTLNDNSTSIINTNASASSSSLLSIPPTNIQVSCFDAQDFRPTTKANYFEAVQKILTREDAFVPRWFWLGPRVRFIWTGGSIGDEQECGIVFGNQQTIFTDMIPVILVAHVAALIADRCLNEENGYVGGWARPGPRNGVVLVGHLIRPDPHATVSSFTLAERDMTESIDT